MAGGDGFLTSDPLRVKQMLSEVDRVRVSPSACLSQTDSWCYPTTNFFLSRNDLRLRRPLLGIEQYYIGLQDLSPVVELVYPSDLKSRVTVNHAST